jgi:predicted N-acetyltransferase YhbS
MTPSWRAMHAADLGAVHAIAEELHPDYPERPEVAAERLHLYPAGCRIVAMGPAVRGYALAHPARFGAPPALDTLLRALPADADALHLHDVAIVPEARGVGLVAVLVDDLAGLARAAGLARLTLVAVHGTAVYWARFGFAAAPAPDIGSYAGATYMARRL